MLRWAVSGPGRRGVYPPVTFSSTIEMLEADEFDREAV